MKQTNKQVGGDESASHHKFTWGCDVYTRIDDDDDFNISPIEIEIKRTS